MFNIIYVFVITSDLKLYFLLVEVSVSINQRIFWINLPNFLYYLMNNLPSGTYNLHVLHFDSVYQLYEW